MSGDQAASFIIPKPTTDLYDYVGLIRHPDGTILRKPAAQFPERAATPDPNQSTDLVLSKDIPVNQAKKTWARVFMPRDALDSSSSSATTPLLLPLIVYFHGGAFTMSSPASFMIHDFCFNIALRLSAVVVSASYRLAPEHRLPAAHDDALEALHWIKTSEDDWLKKHADLTKCVVMGTSSGGNIAYHACLRAAANVDDLRPMRIKGLIMHCPGFSGSERTESELRMAHHEYLPAAFFDLVWELALPVGADRDHEYGNPTVNGGSKSLEKFKDLDWKVLVTGGDKDPLIDRQIGVAKMMEEKGIKVETRFVAGDDHAEDALDHSKMDLLLHAMKNFVFSAVTAE
ncbi:hypothetical protein HS088_TW04G00432 [Tripterygium wilfordii]|uniref:Alpha/beta hydrolase fold-3 domain-containing protein n=1 Tax=Tripterygium wilfordii TaxID=458696 RepID=A0A7J7DQ55_TRIWF|nr:probable carboxylesterase 120 [Tripterygium wilfordii]KAF5748478.1 hypothetical protein HS088_TW04G00432 [Tripterygium wilfordii]